MLTPAQIKPKSVESKWNSFFSFLPGLDAPHVYVRALALGCFYSHISTRTFRRALTASLHGQLRRDKERPSSGVTKTGRVWRKVPESDARCVTDNADRGEEKKKKEKKRGGGGGKDVDLEH